MDRNDDATIRLMYSIAEEIFGEEQYGDDGDADMMKAIRDECLAGKSYLLEVVQDVVVRKQTLASLDQILELVDRRTSVNDIQDEKNGEFAGNYFETHGTHNWEEIFNQGKAKGLYKTYSVWVSVKTAYYRFKKQNKKS